MRKIVGAALAVVAATGLPACRTTSTSGAPAGAAADQAPGATSAPQAVERFVAAARTPDVRTMGSLFGTTDGAVSGRQPEVDVEKRMRALACYLTHDSARMVDDVPGVGRGRIVTMELRQGELVRRPRFNAVAGPRGRWFVESFDINTLADFCRPSR